MYYPDLSDISPEYYQEHFPEYSGIPIPIVYGYKERSTGLIRYIGTTINPFYRRQQHQKPNHKVGYGNYPDSEFEYIWTKKIYPTKEHALEAEEKLIKKYAKSLDNIMHNKFASRGIRLLAKKNRKPKPIKGVRPDSVFTRKYPEGTRYLPDIGYFIMKGNRRASVTPCN